MQSARQCACGALLAAPARKPAVASIARSAALFEFARSASGSTARPPRRSRALDGPPSPVADRRLASSDADPISPAGAGHDRPPTESAFGEPFPPPPAQTSSRPAARESRFTRQRTDAASEHGERQDSPRPARPRPREEKEPPPGWAPASGELWLEDKRGSSGDVRGIIKAIDPSPAVADSQWLIGADLTLERLSGPYDNVPAPMLMHGLERVLFNPGVHVLRDLRSGVYNFDHRLEDLPWPEDVYLERLAKFVRPSEDPSLHKVANERKARYAGSTSSLTATLTHFHRLLVGPKPLNMDMLSAAFAAEAREFGQGSILPASIRVSNRNGVWVIDSDQSWDLTAALLNSNLLSDMGNIGEAFVTTEIDEFRTSYIKAHADPDAEHIQKPQTFAYAQLGPLIMRSQMDCMHPHLPRKTFDIKTRAVVAIRQDRHNHDLASEYRLRTLHGRFESYEREYYDLIRSAFLKNSMQARIGGMDGIFVMHHDTRRVLGFQYIPLEDMDRAITGSSKQSAAAFNLSAAALTAVLDRALAGQSPNDTVTITTEYIYGSISVFVEAGDRLTWHTVYAHCHLRDKPVARGSYVDFGNFSRPPAWDVQLSFGRSDDQHRNRVALKQCRSRQRKLETQLTPYSVTAEMLDRHIAKGTGTSDETRDLDDDDDADVERMMSSSSDADADADADDRDLAEVAVELGDMAGRVDVPESAESIASLASPSDGGDDTAADAADADGSAELPTPPTPTPGPYDFKLQDGVSYRLRPSPLVRRLRQLAFDAAKEPAPERGPEVLELGRSSVVTRPRQSEASER